MSQAFYARTRKRIFDLVCAFSGLIVLSLPLLLVALLIRLSSHGPALFRQIRVGQFGKAFRIFKFRTMRTESTGRGAALTAAGDPRITPIGGFLRKSKIDELPQLINVLIGDMSLVGPRPEVAEYVAMYTEAQKCVLLAKPGMTGSSANVYEEEVLASHSDPEAFYLAMVLPAKLQIDLSYCESIRFGDDLRLIGTTFANILPRMMRVQPHSTRVSPVPNLNVQQTPGNPSGSAPRNGEKGPDLTKRESFDLYSRTNQVLLDGCCFAVSFIGAYIIRFESWPSGPNLRQLVVWLPVLVSVRLGVHFLRGIYRQVWRFVSFLDSIEIAKSIVIVSGIFALLGLLLPSSEPLGLWSGVPLSVIALDGLLSFTSSMGIRGLRRVLYSRQRRASTAPGLPPKPILLYGAGRAGIMLRKELETNRAYDVVGFVDDDPHKVGSMISNTLVLGSGGDLAHLVDRYYIHEVIISMAMASRLTLARTLAKCHVAKVPAKIIPSLQEILTGQVQISQFRETRAEDVLVSESATHLLDRGADLRSLQRLLGHNDLEQTTVYLHISERHLHATASPLDSLSLKGESP